MPAIFYVDQARTFKKVVFLSSEAKIAFGSGDRQDTTRGGVPKWEIQVAATFEQFGRTENEVLKVSVASHSDPGDVIGDPRPVELIGFRVRVNPLERRIDKSGTERVTGGSATYQADEIRALHEQASETAS